MARRATSFKSCEGQADTDPTPVHAAGCLDALMFSSKISQLFFCKHGPKQKVLQRPAHGLSTRTTGFLHAGAKDSLSWQL